jgi:hypothetical protein
MLIVGENHLRRVVDEYIVHCNAGRTHRGFGRALRASADDPNVIPFPTATNRIRRRLVLGGLTSEVISATANGQNRDGGMSLYHSQASQRGRCVYAHRPHQLGPACPGSERAPVLLVRALIWRCSPAALGQQFAALSAGAMVALPSM